jgi:hypothetical protein
MTALDNRGVTVLHAIDQGAWTTVNRPQSANALNPHMRDELAELYLRVETEPEVRVVVLTGAGTRSFCAGMDLKESAAPEEFIVRRERFRASRDIATLAGLTKATIAAVNGFTLGRRMRNSPGLRSARRGQRGLHRASRVDSRSRPRRRGPSDCLSWRGELSRSRCSTPLR